MPKESEELFIKFFANILTNNPSVKDKAALEDLIASLKGKQFSNEAKAVIIASFMCRHESLMKAKNRTATIHFFETQLFPTPPTAKRRKTTR